MKLEEVLPAMRAGRVAVDFDGDRWRIVDGCMEFYSESGDKWLSDTVYPLDGWTLEPEPKVEWPKGSLQWAEMEAKRLGLTDVRRKLWATNGIPEGFHFGTLLMTDEANRHALDWEVVP